MIYTTMIVRNDPRPKIPPTSAFNHTLAPRFPFFFGEANLFCINAVWLSTRRSSPPARSRTGVLRVRGGELNNDSITQKNLQKMALKWLCIGFELALFFLTSQLPILAYQFIKKALTAIFQMLRLALFSQTNPFSNRLNPNPRPKITSFLFFPKTVDGPRLVDIKELNE